jgi:hypothetical protein
LSNSESSETLLRSERHWLQTSPLQHLKFIYSADRSQMTSNLYDTLRNDLNALVNDLDASSGLFVCLFGWFVVCLLCVEFLYFCYDRIDRVDNTL